MKCEECLPLLEEYADGETVGRDAARVEAHLEACAACARARRELEEERALFLSYECDAAPAEGFWGEVLSKIGAEAGARHAPSSSARAETSLAGSASTVARARARAGAALGVFAAPRLSPAMVAVLMLVAVGATVVVMKYATPREEASRREGGVAVALQNRNDAAGDDESGAGENEVGAGDVGKEERGGMSEGGRERVAVRSRGEGKSVGRVNGKSPRVKSAGGEESVDVQRAAGSVREAAPERLVREAEGKYLAAIRLLSRDVSGRRARLDVDARARFERTLAAVDRTIADTRRAAREHPRDPVAVQYMLTAYAKKVELLREMARY